jgi:hypothetical protein
MNLILLWLLAIAGAAVVFGVQVRGYRRADVQPIGIGSAFWLGAGQIAILFGALMMSFGAPDIAAEVGMPVWSVVALNHAANLGAFGGCVLAALSGALPRRLPALLAVAGVAIAVPAFAGGALVPASLVALPVFGGLAAFAVLGSHTRVLAAVAPAHRGAAMGLILSFCLLAGVALVGVPLLGGWRFGLTAVGLVLIALAVAHRRWRGAPAAQPARWQTPRQVLRLVAEHRHLIGGVAVSFTGWVALYTIPSLVGASETTVVMMAIVGQLVAAMLALWAGRRADVNRRRVGREAAWLLAGSLVAVAVLPGLPVVGAVAFLGTTLGWWLCGVAFTAGEYAGNVQQGVLEAELSLTAGEAVREQLVGLAQRFLTVGGGNILLAFLTGGLERVLSGSVLGVAIGLVCAVAVIAGLRPALRRI